MKLFYTRPVRKMGDIVTNNKDSLFEKNSKFIQFNGEQRHGKYIAAEKS